MTIVLCVQSDTFADFEVMTDRLVSEIMYHIDLYSMKPTRVRYIQQSLDHSLTHRLRLSQCPVKTLIVC